MQYSYLKTGLDNIGQTHFGRPWPKEAIKAIAEDLQDVDDRVLVLITKRVYAEISPATFPPLSRIVNMAQEEQKKLNAVNLPDEPKPRHEIDREFQQQFGEKHSEYVKRAWAIIAMTVNHNVSRERLIEGLGVMEKTYPGIGWVECQMGEIRKHRENNPPAYQEGQTEQGV